MTHGRTPPPRSVDGFGGLLAIEHDSRVLTPRGWTAAQSRWMADLLDGLPEGPVLELCAGVGHIGLLTGALTGRDLVLVDASPAACELAERNVAANPVPGSVEVRLARVDEALAPEERFTGILADPPWVPSQQVSTFPDDPLSAIDGGADGLDLARVCVRVIDRHLDPRGVAVLQLGGAAQADRLVETWGADDGDGPDLEPVELRPFERGVLLQLARPA